MGITRFNKEFATPVAPARMFKALILDSHNLIPRLLPESIKSVEFLQGDGGVGSVKLIKFHEWSRFRYVKYIINDLDKEKFMCKYSLIEGEVLGDNLESVVYEVKFEDSGDGGCICKVATEFHTKGDHEIKDDTIQEGKDKATGLYKVVEAHLLANPDIYT